MIKYILALIFLTKTFVGESQAFKYPTGAVIGNQTVISIPIYADGVLNRQALVYLPDDYADTTKKHPLFIFLHGAGEASDKSTGFDISRLINTALPQAISQGLKPSAIDPVTGETVKWIVISPQCSDNSNCSYAYAQLVYIIPYLLKRYRIDLSCIWVGGLSAGGSATFSVPMADSVFGAIFAGMMPISNGGWDMNIGVPAYKNNLITWAKKGGSTLILCGNQDPGYNYASGQYGPLIKANSQPGRYYDSFPAGLAHVSQVWNQPWPLTARVWSKTMNSWTQMWTLRKNAVVVTPPPVIIPPPVTKPIPYIQRIVSYFSDSTNSVIYIHP